MIPLMLLPASPFLPVLQVEYIITVVIITIVIIITTVNTIIIIVIIITSGYIIVTEFCERLAYYGFAGSLVLFFQTQVGGTLLVLSPPSLKSCGNSD
jgi:hypothetical protein